MRCSKPQETMAIDAHHEPYTRQQTQVVEAFQRTHTLFKRIRVHNVPDSLSE